MNLPLFNIYHMSSSQQAHRGAVIK